MYDEILETVINQVAKTKKVEAETLSEESVLAEELGYTSVEIAHLATFLEAEFDVDLPYMKFVKHKTIGEIAQFVEESM